MAEEKPSREVTTRSWWSVALVSAFGGPFGGFLWIGAGRLAVASLAVISALTLAIIYAGFPVLPGVDLAWLARLSGIGLMIPSIALVMPFTHRFKPNRWYAHGLWVLVLVFLSTYPLAFAIRAFLFQPFSIPSGSMVPTLRDGDYLFVSKFAYGYSRYSVPFDLLPVEGRIFGAQPKRGDVAVFKYPRDPSVDYIQRIVGLPGEKIQMIDGVLHINDVAVGLEDAGTFTYEDAPEPVKLQRETLPGGVTHFVLDLSDSIGDNTRAFEVPEGHYFVLGDNRDNASDSRFLVGFVPYENLVGKAVRLFWNSRGTDYSSRQTLDGSAVN
jgi:signal peptidase I